MNAGHDERMKRGFGRRWEQFAVGQEFQHWPGKTVTESDNNMFCMMTMNHHPVHINNIYAGEAHHGRILVVGTLVIALVVGMSVRDISGKAIANLSYDDVRHVSPVFIGDTIVASSEVLQKEKWKGSSSRGTITVQTIGMNQHEEKVLSLKRTLLLPIGEGGS